MPPVGDPGKPTVTNEELSLLVRALAFAAHKHRDQRRKGAERSPYINHPIALVNVLVNEADVTDSEVIATALLHDTIEDTETTGDEIEAQFGARIRVLVEAVTDDKALDKAERKALQIAKAADLPKQAKLVKLADKICNLRDIVDNPPDNWPLERRQAYFEWARQVIDGLRGCHPVLEAVFDAAYARRPGSRQPAESAAGSEKDQQ